MQNKPKQKLAKQSIVFSRSASCVFAIMYLNSTFAQRLLHIRFHICASAMQTKLHYCKRFFIQCTIPFAISCFEQNLNYSNAISFNGKRSRAAPRIHNRCILCGMRIDKDKIKANALRSHFIDPSVTRRTKIHINIFISFAKLLEIVINILLTFFIIFFSFPR